MVPRRYVLSWPIPAELNRQLQLLSVLKLQHVDIHQLSQPFTAQVPVIKKGAADSEATRMRPRRLLRRP